MCMKLKRCMTVKRYKSYIVSPLLCVAHVFFPRRLLYSNNSKSDCCAESPRRNAPYI